MPTYDYQCDACQHEFELFQSIKENPRRKCPECGRMKLRRLFGTGAAVVFKGSGFYQTDYRSESYKQRAAEEKKASSDSSSKPEGKKTEGKKSEGKPEGGSGTSKPSQPKDS